MAIIPNIVTTNKCYTANQPLTPSSVSLYCQKTDLSIRDMVLYFKMHGELDYCVHALVSDDDNIYQLIPWDRQCWHSEDMSVNQTSLAVMVLYNENYEKISDNIASIINTIPFISNNVTTIRYGDIDSEILFNRIRSDFITLVRDKIAEPVTPEPETQETTLRIKADFTEYTMFTVKKNVKIKSRPTTDSATISYVIPGTVTIVNESRDNSGKVWGLLKEYSEKLNGWVKLELL